MNVRRHTHTVQSPLTILKKPGNNHLPPLKNNVTNLDQATATAITTVTNNWYILQELAYEQGLSISMWAESDKCWTFMLWEILVPTT